MNVKIEITIDEMDCMHIRSNLVEREHMIEVLLRAVKNLTPKVTSIGGWHAQEKSNIRRQISRDGKGHTRLGGALWPDAEI